MKERKKKSEKEKFFSWYFYIVFVTQFNKDHYTCLFYLFLSCILLLVKLLLVICHMAKYKRSIAIKQIKKNMIFKIA
jgi:hypothetical protein